MPKRLFFSLALIILIMSSLGKRMEAAAQLNINSQLPLGKGHGIKIIFVTPPAVFAKIGSETTNFNQACSLSDAINMVLDDVGVNKVEFSEPIANMCDNDKIKNLNNYVILDKVGEVTVNSDLNPDLNKPAKVTMRNLAFKEEPDLQVDGKQATSADIDEKKWNVSTKTLEFKAKHFSTYKAIPKGSLAKGLGNLSNTGENLVNKSDKSLLLIVLAGVFVLFALGGGLYFLRNRRR